MSLSIADEKTTCSIECDDQGSVMWAGVWYDVVNDSLLCL